MELSRDGLAEFLGTVLPHLDERQRRVLVGAAVVMWGDGGKTAVAWASGMSRNTVMNEPPHRSWSFLKGSLYG